MTELKQCPFCGTPNPVLRDSPECPPIIIHCTNLNCRAMMVDAKREDAIRRWNRRASEELKPCPFCGEEDPYIVHDETGMYVLCPNCLVELHDKFSLTEQQLSAKWNRRVSE